jgi:hypothetical protein
MLALVSALVLLSPDVTLPPERVQAYLKQVRIYRAPGELHHGLPALLPMAPAGGRYFNFQEGPTAPVVRVYAGPIPSRVTGQAVKVKKR